MRTRQATKGGPEFVRLFVPLIETFHQLGDSGRPKEVSEKIAIHLNVPDEVLNLRSKERLVAFRQSGSMGAVLSGQSRTN